jgi:hypothetical protein
LPHVCRIEANERIHAVFRALDGFGFDFVEGALLGEGAAGEEETDRKQRKDGCRQRLQNVLHVESPSLAV